MEIYMRDSGTKAKFKASEDGLSFQEVRWKDIGKIILSKAKDY
jgi:hypothetical protein